MEPVDLRATIEVALTGQSDWGVDEWKSAAKLLAEALCDERGRRVALEVDRDGVRVALGREEQRHRALLNWLLAALDALPDDTLKSVYRKWRRFGFLPSRELAGEWMVIGRGLSAPKTTWTRAHGRLKLQRSTRGRGRPKEILDSDLLRWVDSYRSAYGGSDASALRAYWDERNPSAGRYRKDLGVSALQARLSRARSALQKSVSKVE